MVKKKGETTYQVTVDYGKSLEQMTDAGLYDSWNHDITAAHFPLSGTSQMEVELHLVYLNQMASADAVLAELDSRNLRPATIAELLALGAQFPNLQNEFPIVAFGSVWLNLDGYQYVASLDIWSGGRRLDLSWRDGGWHGHYRFLAVSK